MKKEIVLLLAGLTINACAGEYYYENGKKVEVHKLPESRVQSSSVEHIIKQNMDIKLV